MFRDMRRIMQKLSDDETRDILARGSHGVLSVIGDEGYPYGVPISYACAGDKIYMHCAKSGHKLDAVRGCGKACFTVVDFDKVVPERFTTHYKSAIAFGSVREVTDRDEMLSAIELLCGKYSPGIPAEDEIRLEWPGLAVLEFTIEHLSGKEATELAKARRGM